MKITEKREPASPQEVFLFVYSREASGEMWPMKIRVISSENGSHKVWESEIKPDPSWPQGDWFDTTNDHLAKAPEAKIVAQELVDLLKRVKQGIVISYHATGGTKLITRLMDLVALDNAPKLSIIDERDLSDHQREIHKGLLMLASNYFEADLEGMIKEMVTD